MQFGVGFYVFSKASGIMFDSDGLTGQTAAGQKDGGSVEQTRTIFDFGDCDMNESFVVHAEYLIDLPEEHKVEFYTYILEYGIFEKAPKLTGFAKTVWNTIQRRIDTDKIKYKIEVLKNRLKAINQRIKAKTNSEKDLKNKDLYEAKLEELYAKINNTFSYGIKSNEKLQEVSYSTPTPDIDNDIDNEFDNESEFERENEFDCASEPAKPAENSLSLSEYSNKVFEIFKNAGLPCCNKNLKTFYKTDFTFALQHIQKTPELKYLQPDDVIGACKNYIKIINDPTRYYKTRKTFEKFVKGDNFRDFLPQNFEYENFIKHELRQSANNSPPENKQNFDTSPCPACRAKKLIYNNDKEKFFCHSCKKEFNFEQVKGGS